MLFTDPIVHYITLNIPDPPDYGGMIDTYYRIQALHSLGVKIHLHCFTTDRKPTRNLEMLCESVHYYPRKNGFLANCSFKPYIVNSRQSEILLLHLLQDNYPIFFDGLHTTYYLNDKRLKDRVKVVRAHNIEHQYYFMLAKLELNLVKRVYFILEAIKLKIYETVIKKSTACLTISMHEQQYFKARYKNVVYLPPFHPFENVESKPGSGKYILFQGDLSVVENIKTCKWLIKNVLCKTDFLCVIAGKNPTYQLRKLASKNVNTLIVANPTNEKMKKIINDAHIIILMALKNNGFKLKLLYALYSGRFCLVNPEIIKNTGLESLCTIAENESEFINNINQLMKKPFSLDLKNERQSVMDNNFNNNSNAKRIVEIMFPQKP